MTFTEGQIFTIGTDGIRIATQAIQEKKERSVPQLAQNFIFPNSSPGLAETKAREQTEGRAPVPGTLTLAAAISPPSVPALSPSCRRLPLLYLGHLIRRQFLDHFRVKGRKLAAEAVSKKTGVHPEGQNGPLATFPSHPEWSCWAAPWREQTFRTKP